MRALRLLPVLGLLACATTVRTQPIVITGHVLDFAGDTFEVVDAGMHAAAAQHLLTDQQIASYEEFVARWDKGYRSAAKTWKEARQNLDEPAAQQAASILAGLISELGTWQFVMLGARQ